MGGVQPCGSTLINLRSLMSDALPSQVASNQPARFTQQKQLTPFCLRRGSGDTGALKDTLPSG